MALFSNLKRKLSILFAQITLVGLALFAFGGNHPEINIMAPLYLGGLNSSDPQKQELAWKELQEQLRIVKAAGIDAVSTDIWWGLVESKGPGQYDWSFYDHLTQLINNEGLKWVPILSFHQLGGNVGDTGYIPLPAYIWHRYENNPQDFPDADSMKFKSEQGNLSKEYVSFWATNLILGDLQRFMENFRDHFANRANIVDDIDISLGPSGELRYPSYNQHDINVGYPSRGAIQAYSLPAVRGFRKAVKEKYQSIDAVKKAWNYNINSFEDIFPPNPSLLKETFWKNREQYTQYGKDFFDYYNEVLVKHGQLLLDVANKVFATKTSMFKNKTITAKIPGIHWNIGADRLAELCAGLIRSSYDNWYSSDSGFGYADTLRVFEPVVGSMPRLLTFTAIEMSDYRDDQIGANSRAKTLVGWIAQAAHARNIEVDGENALGSELNNSSAWENMADALIDYEYKKVTLLRLNEIANDTHRLQLLREFHAKMSATTFRCYKALNGFTK